MDEKNEELVDAQIVEEDSRLYGHAEGEPGGEVADEPALVLGDDDPHDAELHEKILSEECAWKGKILDVHRLEVELPNGHRSARDIVRHPGAAAVVALTESGKIVLVRQYRTAIDRVTVEVPAGKLAGRLLQPPMNGLYYQICKTKEGKDRDISARKKKKRSAA